MVAGRHGGSRDHEFRDRESDVDKVSKRGEYVDFRGENGRDQDYDRSQARHVERQKERDIRDRARNRQQDVKEREMANGGRSSSSVIRNCESSGNGHTKQSGISRRTVDRELGELSSGSGSDDPSDSRVSTNKNANPDNSAQPVVEKKRKFSPIVWDMDEKRVGVTLKNKSKIANDPPPPPSPPSSSPPPALSLAYHQSVQLEVAEVDQLFSGLSSHSRLEVMTIEVAATADLPESAALESPTMPPNFAAEQLEPSMDEEDYVSSRNISSSRWADEGNSPRDEGEIIDEEVMNKRRKKMTSSLEPLNAGVLSPEAGEFTRDSSQEAFSKSSGSGRQSQHSRSASEDEYQDGELDKNDYMEMDDEDGNGTADSEDENSNSVPDLVVPPQRSINMLQACRSVDDFDKLNKIDEGTYGVVFRARDRKSGEVVALKKVKMEKEKEGFPLTSLREINILLSFHHPSVVDVKEVVVGSKLDDIFMVMEYMEHDLKGLMETMKQPFSQSEVKCLMLQLLEGVKYLHDNWVLHRDLKTSNLLLNNRGELKICDFGLARQYGSPLKPYTQLVVTLWYRAPELLLGAKEYSTAIDMWSVGCIMAEMLAKEPLFNGKNEIDQLGKIYKILGTPNEKIWPGIAKLPGVKVNFSKNPYNKLREKFPPTSFSGRPTLSEAGFDLLNKLLTYDPEKRITAEAALKHEWFREVPLPKSKEFMPTYPAQHAHDRRLRRIMKSPDPLQELREKERRGELIGAGSLFG